MSEHEPDGPAGRHRREEDVTAAFAAFYRGVVKQLVGFLVLQGAQLVDAADITQDTLCKAYQRWTTLDTPRAWAFRVASRALIRKIASVSEDPVVEVPVPGPLLRTTADLDHWELQHDVVVALARLPPRQRQVMVWTIYGYTPAEIAGELIIKPATVRANLMKARRALARHLGGTEDSR